MTKLKKSFCLLLVILFSIFIAPLNLKTTSAKMLIRTNKYPIVLVHGLFGWGNDEFFGLNYWGGKNSIKEMLKTQGYEVYTPSIGPLSSNWDRACELYSYLIGGTVDYGQAHSSKAGHNRYGKTYKGVLKDLGKSKNGEIQKVHLIGHSMGGETIRLLAQLLEEGSKDEIQATGINTNSLFKGGQHWIESITTISTPHDGSQEDERIQKYEPFAHDLFAFLAAQLGIYDLNNLDYDLQMDQWGLKREKDESFTHYYQRIFNSPIWKKTHDLSNWDLSLEGAKELNSWVKTQKDIYYFSISCVDTHKDLFTPYQVPNVNMNHLMLDSSLYMGRYTQNKNGHVLVDSSWWRNDGVVSVRSATGPHEGSSDKIIDYNGQAQKGVWNYLGEINNTDHLEIVLQQLSYDQKYLQNKFKSWALMLSQL